MAAPERFVVVAVAASAGGIPALGEMLSSLHREIPAAFLVVQHLAAAHQSVLAEILGRYTKLTTREARDGDRISTGVVLVAPPGHHMIVTRDGTIALTDTPPEHYVRPSADVLFTSVAETFGPRAVAVVLSGTGEDGARGVEAIKSRGGTVLVQQDAYSTFFDGMPAAAIRTGIVDAILPVKKIGPALDTLALQLSANERTGI